MSRDPVDIDLDRHLDNEEEAERRRDEIEKECELHAIERVTKEPDKLVIDYLRSCAENDTFADLAKILTALVRESFSGSTRIQKLVFDYAYDEKLRELEGDPAL